jgi:predicted transcriptional regulator of viral defense system
MSLMAKTPAEKTLSLVKKLGVLRPRDLDRHHIPRQYLHLLERSGKIQRSGRGLYVAVNKKISENRSVAEAAKRVPHGVVCLLSALRLHGLTTQAPSEIWMAIDRKARKPSVDYPPIRIVHFSGDAITAGIEKRRIEGVDVRIFNAPKTVADTFKYRHKIGIDVALEALRDCRRQNKATMDELWHFAKVCRVSNVMRPYLEAVV